MDIYVIFPDSIIYFSFHVALLCHYLNLCMSAGLYKYFSGTQYYVSFGQTSFSCFCITIMHILVLPINIAELNARSCSATKLNHGFWLKGVFNNIYFKLVDLATVTVIKSAPFFMARCRQYEAHVNKP